MTLKNDGDEQGQESYEYERDVTPRICMPWHPRYLKGDFSIMLRRNVGRGAVLERLEVRWWLVSAILKVLMEYHHWYKQDKRLFDVALSDQRNIFAEPSASQQEERVRQQCSEMLAEGAAFNLADHLRNGQDDDGKLQDCLLYTSPSPRDRG